MRRVGLRKRSQRQRLDGAGKIGLDLIGQIRRAYFVPSLVTRLLVKADRGTRDIASTYDNALHCSLFAPLEQRFLPPPRAGAPIGFAAGCAILAFPSSIAVARGSIDFLGLEMKRAT